MYPPGHPSLGPAAERLAARAERLLENRPTIAFGVARHQLIIDGVATDPNQPVLRRLAEDLHRHHLGAISILPGIEADEIASALHTLAEEYDAGEGATRPCASGTVARLATSASASAHVRSPGNRQRRAVVAERWRQCRRSCRALVGRTGKCRDGGRRVTAGTGRHGGAGRCGEGDRRASWNRCVRPGDRRLPASDRGGAAKRVGRGSPGAPPTHGASDCRSAARNVAATARNGGKRRATPLVCARRNQRHGGGLGRQDHPGGRRRERPGHFRWARTNALQARDACRVRRRACAPARRRCPSRTNRPSAVWMAARGPKSRRVRKGAAPSGDHLRYRRGCEVVEAS